jgi:hypothetical protein
MYVMTTNAPVLIPLREKHTNRRGGGPKSIKKTDSGNGKRPGVTKGMHGSFTHCPKGMGDGKAGHHK